MKVGVKSCSQECWTMMTRDVVVMTETHKYEIV
jgi:hypothetical protein